MYFKDKGIGIILECRVKLLVLIRGKKGSFIMRIFSSCK